MIKAEYPINIPHKYVDNVELLFSPNANRTVIITHGINAIIHKSMNAKPHTTTVPKECFIQSIGNVYLNKPLRLKSFA